MAEEKRQIGEMMLTKDQVTEAIGFWLDKFGPSITQQSDKHQTILVSAYWEIKNK